MSFIFLNGEIIPTATAKISIYDRSYLFGEGLFETLRSYDGKLPLLDDHLKRLEWSATFLSLDFPMGVDFQNVCQTLLKKNGLKDARFKILLSRFELPENETGEKTGANLVIFCTPLDNTIPTSYKLKVIKDYVNDAPPIGTIKTTNSLVKILARAVAKEAGFNDGILLNAKGLVTESTTGNIFWVDEKNILRTVAETHGLLRGVMKERLTRLIKEKELTLREDQITPTELSNTREVFLTNSVLGIMPVTRIDHREISGGEMGSVTSMLKDLWKVKLQEMLL